MTWYAASMNSWLVAMDVAAKDECALFCESTTTMNGHGCTDGPEGADDCRKCLARCNTPRRRSGRAVFPGGRRRRLRHPGDWRGGAASCTRARPDEVADGLGLLHQQYRPGHRRRCRRMARRSCWTQAGVRRCGADLRPVYAGDDAGDQLRNIVHRALRCRPRLWLGAAEHDGRGIRDQPARETGTDDSRHVLRHACWRRRVGTGHTVAAARVRLACAVRGRWRVTASAGAGAAPADARDAARTE